MMLLIYEPLAFSIYIYIYIYCYSYINSLLASLLFINGMMLLIFFFFLKMHDVINL
jgi:hypothetical protein